MSSRSRWPLRVKFRIINYASSARCRSPRALCLAFVIFRRPLQGCLNSATVAGPTRASRFSLYRMMMMMLLLWWRYCAFMIIINRNTLRKWFSGPISYYYVRSALNHFAVYKTTDKKTTGSTEITANVFPRWLYSSSLTISLRTQQKKGGTTRWVYWIWPVNRTPQINTTRIRRVYNNYRYLILSLLFLKCTYWIVETAKTDVNGFQTFQSDRFVDSGGVWLLL